MTHKGKEIVIDGDVYIDSRAVDEMFNGLIPDNTIRELGKQWGRHKVGNRYFYLKSDVKLPDYPVAKWQRMVLMYLSLRAPDSPVMQFAEGNYYHALSFLNGAGVEKLGIGKITTNQGLVDFVLFAMTAKVYRLHLVVMDGTLIAGRQLEKGEARSIDIVHHEMTADFHSWNTPLLIAIANQLLSTTKAAS